jgi:predicted ATPase
MILPEDFPYLTSIYVNDCYTYQNFQIDLEKHQPFSHLILTGKNGSGKSTILKALNNNISLELAGTTPVEANSKINRTIEANPERFDLIKNWNKQLEENQRIIVVYSRDPFFSHFKKEFIYSFLLPFRKSEVNRVETPTKQEDFEKQIIENTASSDFFIKNFKQFLVNKKVNQAFAQLDNKAEEIAQTDAFFQTIEEVFGKIFEDSGLKLVFVKEQYEFFMQLSDGRKLTLNILPDGFSAFLSILMDLFIRLELIRKETGNYAYNPCGIVLIDEPETHLHLSLQYQVLPILTALFPNIQFIVATHSPAVISSIRHVTIFDLTTKELLSDEAIGKSFSELMVSHFGLDNEFSDFTDKIFDEFNSILRQNRGDAIKRNEKIKALLAKNEQYLSPTMRFELEAKLLESI